MKKIIIIFAIFFLAACSAAPEMAILPTETTSIQSLVNNAAPGSTVYVQAGSYDERIVINKSVSIICNSSQLCTTKGFDIRANNVTVKGFRIKDATLMCFDVVGNNTLIEGNRCETVWQRTATDRDGVNFFGDNNVFRNNYFLLDGNDQRADHPPHPDCFQTWGDPNGRGVATNTLFEGNTCINPDQGAVISETTGTGFMLGRQNNASPKNIIIRNNIITAWRPILAIGIEGLSVSNNVFYGNPSGGTWKSIYWGEVTNGVLKNNIFYDLERSMNLSGAAPTAGYNLTYRTDGKSMDYYSNFPPQSTDKWNVNPMFVSYPNDLHLQDGSPACAGGENKTYIGAFPCSTIPPTLTNVPPTATRTPTASATSTKTETSTPSLTPTNTLTSTPTKAPTQTFTPIPTVTFECLLFSSHKQIVCLP